MTDETIRKCLARLNRAWKKKKFPKDVFIAQIAKRVWWGCCWGTGDQIMAADNQKPIHPSQVAIEPSIFYFVQASDGFFAGAVMDGGSQELHVYVLPRYRHQRLLVEPLKKTILPHKFTLMSNDWVKDGRKKQRITIDLQRPWAEYARKQAERVGFVFEETKEHTACLTADETQFPKFKFNTPKPNLAEVHRVWYEFRRRARNLGFVMSKIRMLSGLPFPPENLNYWFAQLQYFTSQVEGIFEGMEWQIKE